MASGVSDLEDRGGGDELLEFVESGLAAFSPCEGLGGAGELDEGGDLFGVHVDVVGRDNVTKVFYARGSKCTLAELGVKLSFSKDGENFAKVFEVGFEGGAKDEDIIKVDHDTDFEEVAKDVTHCRLECCGGIGESEGHHEELVVPEVKAKGGFVGVLLADADLVEVTEKIDLGEILGSTEAIKKLGYVREWVLVLDCDPVQGTVVCAHAEFRGAVLLNEETTGSEGGGARLNESFLKEFIKLSLHLFGLGDEKLVRSSGVSLLRREGGVDEGGRELQSLRSILMNWTTSSSSKERDEESSESEDASGFDVVNSSDVVEVVSSEAMPWKKRGRGGANRGGGVATVEVMVDEDGGDVDVEVEAEACPEEGVVWGVEEGVVVVTTVMAGVFPSSVVTRSEMAAMVVLMVSREDWRAVNVRRKVVSSGVAVVKVGGLPASSGAILSTESERISNMLMDD
ncbi:hypothetical protein CBR_g81536 [Chara braunii]|uniref:Uncharacterized protein n=1 Tax=Chara braunii TaxID=69332 RepID=A0A388KAK9_CHABU|nr:hypothetical protein CBR_g81536 [Chara braunii]|eukprot:GBG67112.1 hypothetical protein CBR_g81536 [Chara braunii]